MTIIWSGSAVVSIAASLEDEFDIDITGADSDLFTDYFVDTSRKDDGPPAPTANLPTMCSCGQ